MCLMCMCIWYVYVCICLVCAYACVYVYGVISYGTAHPSSTVVICVFWPDPCFVLLLVLSSWFSSGDTEFHATLWEHLRIQQKQKHSYRQHHDSAIMKLSIISLCYFQISVFVCCPDTCLCTASKRDSHRRQKNWSYRWLWSILWVLRPNTGPLGEHPVFLIINLLLQPQVLFMLSFKDRCSFWMVFMYYISKPPLMKIATVCSLPVWRRWDYISQNSLPCDFQAKMSCVLNKETEGMAISSLKSTWLYHCLGFSLISLSTGCTVVSSICGLLGTGYLAAAVPKRYQ